MKAFAQKLHHVYEKMENWKKKEFTYLSVSEKLLRDPFDTDTNDFRQKENKVVIKFQLELLQLQNNTDLLSKAPKGMPMLSLAILEGASSRAISIFEKRS